MEKLKVIVAPNLRELITKANSEEIQKNQIVSILFAGHQFYLIYSI